MSLNCLGNEVQSGCVLYSGPDIPSLDIRFGDILNDVILKIANATNGSVQSSSEELTSDNITSKGLIRNNGSILAANIIKRDFAYKLTSGSGGSTILNWDLLPVIRQLPSNYEAVLTKVRVSGKPTSSTNVIVDSRSPSASLVIPVDRYPVTVDFSIRVTAPSGNIDLDTTVDLVNPSVTGSYRAILDANDLNPQSGQTSLTTHLNSIEGQISGLKAKQETMPDLSGDLEEQKLAVEELRTLVDSPSTLNVDYTKDGTATSGEIKNILTDLYSQIKTLKDKDSSQQTELANLRSQIDSLS